MIDIMQCHLCKKSGLKENLVVVKNIQQCFSLLQYEVFVCNFPWQSCGVWCGERSVANGLFIVGSQLNGFQFYNSEFSSSRETEENLSLDFVIILNISKLEELD